MPLEDYREIPAGRPLQENLLWDYSRLALEDGDKAILGDDYTARLRARAFDHNLFTCPQCVGRNSHSKLLGLLAKAKIAFLAGHKIVEQAAVEGAEGDADLGSDVEEFPIPGRRAAPVVVTAAPAAAAFMYDAIQWLRTGEPALPEEKDQQHKSALSSPILGT